MKSDSNLVEMKLQNYKSEKKSPIKTLLKLVFNSNNKTNISLEKTKLHLPLNLNNNILSKDRSARNVNSYYNNFFIQNSKKPNFNNENTNDNCNNNLLLKKICINNNNYNNIIKKNKKMTANYDNNRNTCVNKKIGAKNEKQKIIKRNNYNYLNQNLQNNLTTCDNKRIKSIYINKNYENLKNNNKDLIHSNNIKNNNINNYFNSKLEISDKKEEKLFKKENNNDADNMPNTNRNSSYITFYNKC